MPEADYDKILTNDLDKIICPHEGRHLLIIGLSGFALGQFAIISESGNDFICKTLDTASEHENSYSLPKNILHYVVINPDFADYAVYRKLQITG